MNTAKTAKPNLPAYLDLIYGDIYNDAEKCAGQDNAFTCSRKLFFQYRRLVNAAVRELKMNQSVLQMGIVFGSEMDEIAMAVGAYGQYDIVDINPLQVERVTEKYWKVYPGMKIFCQDAAGLKLKNNYDVVLCFMLLSEVPSATKSKIINNALKMVKPGGKAVFVDWHNPLYYHPLRYIVRMYNRLYHPFVERLWDRDINTFAAPEIKTQFIWRKSTYFGRMFQKLVAERKENPLEEKKEEENFFESSAFGLADF